MIRARNQLGQTVSVTYACRHRHDHYYCPGCGTTLILRCGDERQCFAHPPGVEPNCEYRVDEGFGDKSLPRLDSAHDLNEVGESLINAFSSDLGFDHPGDDDAILDTTDVTRAQLLTIVLGRDLWDSTTFSPEQIDAANVLARLASSDLAGCLRQILAAWIRSGYEKSNFEAMPEILRRSACRIAWSMYFAATGEMEPLPSPWMLFPGGGRIPYDRHHGRFGTLARGFYRNVSYSSPIELASTGIRSLPLKIARLSLGRDGSWQCDVGSSDKWKQESIRMIDGESLILYGSPRRPAHLYVIPSTKPTVPSSALPKRDGPSKGEGKNAATVPPGRSVLAKPMPAQVSASVAVQSAAKARSVQSVGGARTAGKRPAGKRSKLISPGVYYVIAHPKPKTKRARHEVNSAKADLKAPPAPHETAPANRDVCRLTRCTRCAHTTMVPADALKEHLREVHGLHVDKDGRVR